MKKTKQTVAALALFALAGFAVYNNALLPTIVLLICGTILSNNASDEL